MTPAEALDWLRDQVEELQRRRPGCPDKNCGVCKRFAIEDRHTAEALGTLAALVGKQ